MKTFVENYNNTPENQRKSFLNISCPNIVETKLLTVYANGNKCKTFLQIVPIWATSINAIDSADPEDLRDRFIEAELDNIDMWKTDLKLTVVTHD